MATCIQEFFILNFYYCRAGAIIRINNNDNDALGGGICCLGGRLLAPRPAVSALAEPVESKVFHWTQRRAVSSPVKSSIGVQAP